MEDRRPPETATNGGATTTNTLPTAATTIPVTKRQRRPSVRLGDLGSDPSLRRMKPPKVSSGGATVAASRRPRSYRPAKPEELTSGADSKPNCGGDDHEARFRVGVSGSPSAVERDLLSGSEGGDWNDRVGDGGVRLWLEKLGLARYAPVFEIHEVDDEVLPFLTIEDLKDMGINAVGSRRKMYCAIQKLRRSIS
ncbi:uncharacterized protein [Typha latifolia]|uniref:uncharacterized protein n=1 Tax=Typha latifolia TaxID=4733 RepID=UPI003C3051B2